MRSRIRAAILLALAAGAPVQGARPAGAQLPPEAGKPEGPSGTAGAGTAAGYDAVGYASWYGDDAAGRTTASGEPFVPDAIGAAHRTLPLGSYVEVTALDTGRTMLVRIDDRGPGRADREVDLSMAAAKALGTDTRPVAPVRVRSVTPSPAEVAQLKAGRPVMRLDTPEALLRALRRKLPEGVAAAPPARPARPAPTRKPTPAPRVTVAPPPDVPPVQLRPPATNAPRGRFEVQVGAFSSRPRAQSLAKAMHGRATPAGGLWRVRLGPFADRASAQRARDAAAARGYADATVRVAD